MKKRVVIEKKVSNLVIERYTFRISNLKEYIFTRYERIVKLGSDSVTDLFWDERYKSNISKPYVTEDIINEAKKAS